MGGELLKSLLLQRLRGGTQAILACAVGGPLELLAATVDKIHEVHARPVGAELSRECADETVLRRQLAALTNNVSTLIAAVDTLRSSKRSRTRSTAASKN